MFSSQSVFLRKIRYTHFQEKSIKSPRFDYVPIVLTARGKTRSTRTKSGENGGCFRPGKHPRADLVRFYDGFCTCTWTHYSAEYNLLQREDYFSGKNMLFRWNELDTSMGDK